MGQLNSHQMIRMSIQRDSLEVLLRLSSSNLISLSHSFDSYSISSFALVDCTVQRHRSTFSRFTYPFLERNTLPYFPKGITQNTDCISLSFFSFLFLPLISLPTNPFKQQASTLHFKPSCHNPIDTQSFSIIKNTIK